MASGLPGFSLDALSLVPSLLKFLGRLLDRIAMRSSVVIKEAWGSFSWPGRGKDSGGGAEFPCLLEAFEEWEQWPSGSTVTKWEPFSSKIRIVMIIGISPSNCGKQTSHFLHGLTDIFELLAWSEWLGFLEQEAFFQIRTVFEAFPKFSCFSPIPYLLCRWEAV